MDGIYQFIVELNQLPPHPDVMDVKSKIQHQLDRINLVRNQLPLDMDTLLWREVKELVEQLVEQLIQHQLMEGTGTYDIDSDVSSDSASECEDIHDEGDYLDLEEGTYRQTGPIARGFRRIYNTLKPKNMRLMRATKVGNHTRVEMLLKDRADPNTKDVLQWTLLMWASHRGHVETVIILLQYGADPNLSATNGYTALILASRRGNYDVVRVLLDPSNRIKTVVNARNNRGWSALMWACQSYAGIFGTKRRFVTSEAMKNRRNVAEILLEAGADVNLETNDGWTPLMQTSQDGDVEMVKILVSADGVDIDHQSKNTWSALTTACQREKKGIVKVLVDAGADVNQKKKGGITALHIASYKNMMDTVEVLTTAGEEPVDIQDEWGMTPLILAVKCGHQLLTEYLIVDAKANVNLTAAKYARWSAVFFAIKNGDQETVDFLMENKADVNTKDQYDHSPLSYSKGQKKTPMYKHLVRVLCPEEGAGEATPTEGGHSDTIACRGGATPMSRDAKLFTPADRVLYTCTEVLWRATQLPNIRTPFGHHCSHIRTLQ